MAFKNPELVFKTTSPAAIAWYENIVKLRKEEWELRRAFEDEIVARFGPSQRRAYASEGVQVNEDGNQTGRPLWVCGDLAYALDSAYNEAPPADSGWRLDSKARNWQPKLATKEGKEWARRLRELNLVKMRTRWAEIGVPEVAFGDRYMYSPGVEFDEESKTLFIGWGTQYVEKEFLTKTAAFPEIEWTRVPLSEWHARQEARSATSG